MVKTADPPALITCDVGLTVRFTGADPFDTVPVPPPLKVIVTAAEPLPLRIDMELGLTVGTQGVVWVGCRRGSRSRSWTARYSKRDWQDLRTAARCNLHTSRIGACCQTVGNDLHTKEGAAAITYGAMRLKPRRIRARCPVRR